MARDNSQNLGNGSPRLFDPLVTRALEDPGNGSILYETQDGSLTNDSSLGVSSSFKYDGTNVGIKNTQQLNVDWSAFENHTFFNSAQVKTNVAFEKILNEYPFDGKKQAVELFLDDLTGFERWVFDNFPKNKDYLFFSGTQPGETSGGTYVTVQDIAGTAYPNASSDLTAESKLSLGYDSLSVEFFLWLPEQANSSSIIFDAHTPSPTTSNGIGYGVVLYNTSSTDQVNVGFTVVSESIGYEKTMTLTKGQWNHIAWVWDRSPASSRVLGYKNGILEVDTDHVPEFSAINTYGSNVYIGSGSAFTQTSFTPLTTLSGAIDEFRVWSDVRTADEINSYKEKAIFAQDNLELYYKFNEPSGLSTNIVIDYSDSSLHGKLSITGQTLGVRDVTKTALGLPGNPMLWEKELYSPILFPDNSDVVTLNTNLLVSASNYDNFNPNLITRLIPPHYLQEGKFLDGFEVPEGDIIDLPTAGTDPKSSNKGATQVLLLMLYTMAKFFDEVKLFTQAFADLQFVDYDTDDTVPDAFLQNLAERNGLVLPPLFQGSTIEQFVEGENLEEGITTSENSLQKIQNEIWRRILVNMQDFISSKGTIHSVKSFIRSIGVDPDSTLRIKEYGGPSVRSLDFVRETKTETTTMLDFSNGGVLSSSYLVASGTRTEPGYPTPSTSTPPSPIVIENNLLTSGSFSYEGTYKMNPNSSYTSQSLVSMYTSVGPSFILLNEEMLNVNVVANNGGPLTLYTDHVGVTPTLSMSVDANLFDGDVWYVSFGRIRPDDTSAPWYDSSFDTAPTEVSCSWFLRAAKQFNGEIIESYNTASFYKDSSEPNNIWSSLFYDSPAAYNPSGSYFLIGNRPVTLDSSGFGALNDDSLPNIVRTSDFDGKVTQIRFWSKYLTDTEYPEHVRNFRSVGVENPKTNFNFNTLNSGSWERLRLDASTDQIVTASNASGEIILTDFTQNNFELYGSGFPATSSVIVPETIRYSYISPAFDEAVTTEKVRVRGYLDYDKVQETPWAEQAPAYSIPASESPTDNQKFSIDFSVIDALDQDIITIFSTLNELDNAIGNPELMFSEDYPCLQDLRMVYFNKLTDQMNLKSFFDIFKWFDTNIGTFVEQLLPRKTKFLGTNYVIQSHMLERSKVQYKFEDMYVGSSNRNGLKTDILLQFIQGQFGRY